MEENLKQLLLRDLCARLPYGVIIKHKDEHGKSIDARLVGYNGDWFNYYIDDLCFHLKIHEFKPYLRPMSSMTEEENEEFEEFFISYSISQDRNCVYHASRGDLNLEFIDWLNAHHFDYRRLIEKGLAIEAPEGMYNIEKK